ncbi:unnamed protein product [Spodoptera littoralis]|uniref:Lipase domain-containing protein n=1 Tax=Spodoptera littoralis TaxID=7109 RepID=A0A9P0HZ08_SPOLI|nr:unnamed protein product [Spodoptera littoralis]CAH1637014.1 unnamed protein product [Spodoptera littoralis]
MLYLLLYLLAMIVKHLELVYITKCLLFVSLYAASVPHTVPAKFTLSNFFDSTLSMIHPLVSAGSDRCESLKSFLGITYEQMQVKNKTNWYDVLNIDLVTKNGNIKFNLTATKRMNRLMARAQTIVILIHGFMESSNGWMVNAIAPELLKKSMYKVFALDGRKIINLEYFSSSTNARFMGELLGSFLGDVIRNGEDPSKIYIIGHSLGSHIAGIAGKKVYEVTGKRIGRITALDPAGPCFSNISDTGRLARTDAEYVDVVHSNAGILGFKAPVIKTFTQMEGSSSLDAICLYVTTAELGSYLQNLLHHLNTFQVHPMAYGCTCFTPISYLIVTIWILVALFFAASVALFCGIVNDDALLCSIWIWYTLIFVVIMLMLMTLLALLFTSRRQTSRVFVAILGMLWYVLTIYFILVVNSHRKALSKAETEGATKAPPAGGPVESGNEPTSDAPSGDASPTDSPTGDATTADASTPEAPQSDATPLDTPPPDAPSSDAPTDEPPPDSPDARKALRKTGHKKAALSRLTTATAAKPMLQCTMVPTIRHKKGQRLHQYKKSLEEEEEEVVKLIHLSEDNNVKV